MHTYLHTVAFIGLDGHIIEVEVDISAGLPSFDVVGLASKSVLESKERIRSAIKNSGFIFPLKKLR